MAAATPAMPGFATRLMSELLRVRLAAAVSCAMARQIARSGGAAEDPRRLAVVTGGWRHDTSACIEIDQVQLLAPVRIMAGIACVSFALVEDVQVFPRSGAEERIRTLTLIARIGVHIVLVTLEA